MGDARFQLVGERGAAPPFPNQQKEPVSEKPTRSRSQYRQYSDRPIWSRVVALDEFGYSGREKSVRRVRGRGEANRIRDLKPGNLNNLLAMQALRV